MGIQTLNGIPNTFTAGDTTIFTECFADFPATTWALKLYLSINGAASYNLAATTSGTSFLFTIPASATLVPGEYRYSQLATSGSQAKTAKDGVVFVLPNYATGQTQTTAQAMLAALETAITALSSRQFKSTSFNGQSQTTADLPALFDKRVQLQAEVLREQAKIDRLRGGPDPSRIKTQFAPVFCQPPYPPSWPWNP